MTPLTGDRWRQIKQILNELDGVPPEALPGAIAAACGGDDDLRREVESLLSFEERAEALDRAARPAAGGVPGRIGPYRIERLLGAGGMGAVYLAVRDDDQYRKQVAIKVTAAGDPDLLDRFRAERQIVAGLDHPYIARLLDGGALADGRPYFVMEYIAGRRIDVYVAEKKLDIAAVLRLFLKVCAAVQFAHQSLVVHRDLKAGNILVSEDGDPHLLDFGIAKVLDPAAHRNAEITQTLLRRMTPASASPEQVAGKAVTVSTDVYALGVLLYRLLTGVSPYGGAKDFETDPARAILEYEPPPPSHAPGVPPKVRRALAGDLDNIVRKAIEKEPARRYASVEDLAADIERHLKGLPVQARPASFSYRMAKFTRRNRLAVTAAALVGLAVAAGLAGTLRYARRAHLEQMRAQHGLAAVSKLTQSFLFEFDDAIKNLPGSSPARELVERRAVEYLDKLASEAGDDPAMLNDLADAYLHVARMTGAIREARGESSPRKALQNGLKALALRRRAFALNSGDEKLRLKLEDGIWLTGASYFAQGDIQHAAELYMEHIRMGESALQRADSVEERLSLGAGLTSMGSIEQELGHYDLALAWHRRALAVREGLLKADPTSARAQRAMGISHEFMGYVFSDRQDYAAAADEHRKALALFEPTEKAGPRNANLQRLEAVARENLCESLALSGAAQEAVGQCEAAIAIYGGMAASDPKNLQASEDLASCESTTSIALDLAGSPRTAFDHQRKARRLFELAARRDPDAADLAEENGDSLMELAKLRRQLHIGGAEAAAAEAVRVLQGVAARSPESRRIAAILQRAEDLDRSMR
jgi:tetratricopeptide (TPR) repeat protein